MEQFLAMVAVENVAYHFDILYTYIIPPEFTDKISAGSRVMVPFGKGSNSKRQGVVFSVCKSVPDKGTKKILLCLDETPFISSEGLKIAEFLKDRTFCTYFEAVKIQIPSGISYKTTVRYYAVENKLNKKLSGPEEEVYNYMMSLDSPYEKKHIYSSLGISADCDVIDRLTNKKLVIKCYEAKKNIADASTKSVKLIVNEDELEQVDKLTVKQKKVIETLKTTGGATVKELCYFTGVTASVINTLQKRGIVEIYNATYYRTPETLLTDNDAKKEINLTESQRNAYEQIIDKYKNTGGVSLLYGITGSGKTSVFLKAIDQVIADNRQVIVMVPEISLTPQMMSIFKSRYGSEVAIFHSALSAGERHDEYKRVKDGLVKIVVGTRSAVFAPFDNIGLIVIDEEQEHTYKSESSPRFHTKDVARFRAAHHNALLLLSSATPSIESYTNAMRGKYSFSTLTQRYGDAVLPDVTVVDMKNERQSGNKYSISSVLLQMLEENLKNKMQSILLMNRRGFNTFVACDSCGSVVNCPSCSISMTYHSANNRLMCHYCGYSQKVSTHCPECGKDDVRFSGYGTQRVEQELELLLPEARILRIDTDSASSRHKFEKGLLDFSEGKYDILLGTQMVAKGLNFENVTVVGVINADQQLNNDDFRSEERTFDLLTQVVGRSGRGKYKGKAVIQTLTPENHIICLAEKQDYEGFYNNEIIIRKAMIYPPFCDLCSVTFVSEKEIKALDASKKFLARLKELTNEEFADQKIIVLGPVPPRISKINNKFKYRLIIKCINNKTFRSMMSKMLIEFGKDKAFSDVTVTADINPENLI